MRPDRSGGFTFIELLVVTFVVGFSVVGIFGLFVLSLRTAQEGERRVAAVALANERAEMIRNLPYLNVGTLGGLPSGPIPQEEAIFRNGLTYTVRTDIRYFDDPYDGTAPADALNIDYKQARVEVSWPSPNNATPILEIMHIAPVGIEGGEAAGTLDFQALTAAGAGVSGATVHLVNESTNPTVDFTTQADDTGRVLLPGLPVAAGSYELSVSKAGLTSEQTYDTTASFIPDADHTHLSALQGQVTEKTFFVDQTASVDVTTQDEAAQPIGTVAYSLIGTRTIGIDGAGQPVYVFDYTGQTDATGSATHEELVWDSYALTIDGAAAGYDIKETNMLLPISVDPAEAVDLVVTLTPHTTISLHVSVATAAGLPVDNATVRITATGVDETNITGAVGQVFFPDLLLPGDYALEVSAPGFTDLVSTVTVSGTTRTTVQMTPL